MTIEERGPGVHGEAPRAGTNGGFRRGVLVAVGISEIAFAALALVAATLMWVFVQARADSVIQARAASPAMVQGVYDGALVTLRSGLLFAVLGWGTLRCRRWARSLQQALFGLWLFQGVVQLPLSLGRAFPQRGLELTASPSLGEPSPFLGTSLVLLGWQLCWHIVVPYTLFRFFRSSRARAASERYDPQSRWTDACSPPLMAVLVLLGLSAVDVLLLGVAPFVPASAWFGLGIPDGVLRVLLAAAFAGLTFGLYRRSRRAWWAAVLFLGIGTLLGLVKLAYPVRWNELPAALRAALAPGSWIDRLLALEPWRPVVVLSCSGLLWISVLLVLLRLPAALAAVEEPEATASHFS